MWPYSFIDTPERARLVADLTVPRFWQPLGFLSTLSLGLAPCFTLKCMHLTKGLVQNPRLLLTFVIQFTVQRNGPATSLNHPVNFFLCAGIQGNTRIFPFDAAFHLDRNKRHYSLLRVNYSMSFPRRQLLQTNKPPLLFFPAGLIMLRQLPWVLLLSSPILTLLLLKNKTAMGGLITLCLNVSVRPVLRQFQRFSCVARLESGCTFESRSTLETQKFFRV